LPDRRSSTHSDPRKRTPTTTPEELTRALRLPEAYPHRPGSVDFEQTQMSLVFLAGDFVYKVKKPVNLGYLDYSTLDARLSFCHKEVELNQRLCAHAYLGVVPIVRHGDRFVVEGAGKPVEYAVKMKRLPADRMLDRMVQQGTASAETLERVAKRIADFHLSGATTEEISSYGDPSIVKRNTGENFEQTGPYIGRTITESCHSVIKAYTNNFLRARRRLFETRIKEGRILDCHGDLHAAHVCMIDEVCIYDCIEFNDRFRYGDVASEVAFLAMDLDRYCRRDLANTFVSAYVARTGDDGLLALLDFYKSYRAFVRGKVEGFRATDQMATDEEREAATWRARRYFELARSYATGKGTLVIMSGVSGSGKSRIAAELGQRLGCTVLASDIIRKELAGLSPSEQRHERYGQGLYSEEWTRRTYSEMIRRGTAALEDRQCVVLDAAFLFEWEREEAIQAAERSGVRPIVAECTAPYEMLLERLGNRVSVSDARPEILDRQLETLEPIQKGNQYEHIILDTRLSPGNNVEELWKHL